MVKFTLLKTVLSRQFCFAKLCKYVELHSNNNILLEGKVVKNWRGIVFLTIEQFVLTPLYWSLVFRLLAFWFSCQCSSFLYHGFTANQSKLLIVTDIELKQVFTNLEFRDILYSFFGIAHIIIVISYWHYSWHFFCCCSFFSGYKYWHVDMPNYRFTILIRHDFSRYYVADINIGLFLKVVSLIMRKARVSAN